MIRSKIVEAVVLSISSFGEGHRSAKFFTNTDDGNIIQATVFGGAKTKRKSGISPFQTGKLWLYYNPIKNSYKVTDFEAIKIRANINSSLIRIWCASFLSELTIKMDGNTNWTLINAFLDGINTASDSECKIALLRFIWRIILYSGVAPNLSTCIRCGNNINEDIFYIPYEDDIICQNCITNNEIYFKLSNESVNYLLTIKNKPPIESRRLTLSENAFSELKSFLFFLISKIVGQKLKTIESGIL